MILLHVGVVNKLADRLSRTAHVAPANMQAALIQHAYPTAALKARKCKPDGQSFQRLQQPPTKGAPDQNGAKPARKGDHDEREKECGNEDFIERWPVISDRVRVDAGGD